MKNFRFTVFAVPAFIGLIAGMTLVTLSSEAPASSQDGPPAGAAPGNMDLGAMLVKGLTETPGCLGVDLGEFKSGRQSVFAWFEDKAAVKAWYYSRTHMGMVNMVMGDEEPPPPLEHVTEDGPILVIASITPTEKPEIPGFPMPINQISIELFRALPGGAHVNGRLSPDTFTVPHMRDYSTALSPNGEG